MAILPPMVGPRAALKDLTAFLKQRSREQVIAASLATLVTIIIVIIFFVDSTINTAPPQQVVYVENYGPDRPTLTSLRPKKASGTAQGRGSKAQAIPRARKAVRHW
jgi:hypothetical protein